MAMKVYNYVWANSTNRTLIFSFLMIIWSILIELYFIFYPLDLIKENIFLGWLYTDVFGFTPFLDVFHLIIWGIAFFFTWIVYGIVKEIIGLPLANVTEYIVFVFGYGVFVTIFNGIGDGILFVGVCFIEFLYFFMALREQ